MKSQMMQTDMWQFISEQISENTGHLFVCHNRQTVAGGDTHQCAIVRDDSRRFFVKYRTLQNGDRTELDAEADGLEALSAADSIQTPRVICHGQLVEQNIRYEYLVLQYLRLTHGPSEDWFKCGEQLAFLHQQGDFKNFGWHRNNFIGKSRQVNTWQPDWASFFAENRIGAMLEALASQGHSWCNIDVCATRVHHFLASHKPKAALLHGDLWSGNVGFHLHRPVVYDPAVYIGDRETDIAMTELFGRLPEAFYDGYDSVWPLPEDYPKRRKLYQLYHILNHALMFGGHYLHVAQQEITQINQQL